MFVVLTKESPSGRRIDRVAYMTADSNVIISWGDDGPGKRRVIQRDTHRDALEYVYIAVGNALGRGYHLAN